MNLKTKYINFKKYWSFKQNQGNSSAVSELLSN